MTDFDKKLLADWRKFTGLARDVELGLSRDGPTPEVKAIMARVLALSMGLCQRAGVTLDPDLSRFNPDDGTRWQGYERDTTASTDASRSKNPT
jgi:hypothetical protein